MTDLKTDSQSIRTVQAQPSVRKRAAKAIQPPEATPNPANTASESNPAEANSETVEATIDDAPKRKRRTTTAKTTTPKTKRQATTKSSKQTASTQVKLAWEPNHSTIAARFAQLEAELQHINEQSSAILSEMNKLKEISEKVQAPENHRTHADLKLPLQSTQVDTAIPPVGNSEAIDQETPASMPPEPTAAMHHTPRATVRNQASQPISTEAPRFVQSTPASSVQPSHPSMHRATARGRRRFTMHRLAQRLLKLPSKPAGVAIDAALWILAAAGLRYGLNLLVAGVPFLAAPVNVLLFVPALVAAYTALFVPQANRIGIYRLLLVALGLFVGGKL